MALQPSQYRGALSPAQAAEGIALARANASRLIGDAELLLEAGRHPSSMALAILAIEELGKVQILKSIVLFSDPDQLKKAWRDYRSHRAKNVHWIIPKLAAEGARTLEALRPATNKDGEHTAILDGVKQLALYTDCFTNAVRWSEPSDAVDPDFAPSIIALAKILNRDRKTEVRELELWVQLVAPVYAAPGMLQAVIEFQRRMVEEGLSETPAAVMEAFMKGQPFDLALKAASAVD